MPLWIYFACHLSLTSAHKTSVIYDAALRPITSTNQDGTFRRTVYEPLLTRSYDEHQTDPGSPFFGALMAHYQDGLGRLVRVEEIVRLKDDGTSAGMTNVWTTRYEYDMNDQLTRSMDSQNNSKLRRYDGLKRKVFTATSGPTSTATSPSSEPPSTATPA